MEARTMKKVALDGAALLAMLTKVASNPILLAYLTGRPHELLKEYHHWSEKKGCSWSITMSPDLEKI